MVPRDRLSGRRDRQPLLPLSQAVSEFYVCAPGVRQGGRPKTAASRVRLVQLDASGLELLTEGLEVDDFKTDVIERAPACADVLVSRRRERQIDAWQVRRRKIAALAGHSAERAHVPPLNVGNRLLGDIPVHVVVAD